MWEFEKTSEQVKKLIKQQIDIFRINLKTLSTRLEFEILQDVIENLILHNPQIKFMIDIDIPNESPRIKIVNSDQESNIVVKKNEIIFLKIGKAESKKQEKTIYLDVADCQVEQFRYVNYIIYDRGQIILKVVSRNKSELFLKADREGLLWSGKSVHFDTGYLISGEKADLEIEFIKKIPQKNVYAIALSFVQNNMQLLKSQKILGSYNFLCKIEDVYGYENLDEICKNDKCHGIYIGRGDLVFTMFGKDFCEIQEHCVLQAHLSGKSIIIGTDILESMASMKYPSRSDMTDWYFIKRLNLTGVVLSSTLSYSNGIFDTIKFIKM